MGPRKGHNWSRAPRARALAETVAPLVAVLMLASCSNEQARAGESLIASAEDVGAMAGAPDGSLVWAVRGTGDLNRSTIEGSKVTTKNLGRIPVGGSGRRGVLGLVVSKTGTIYASYTSPEGANPLVVAELAGDQLRTIWQGPASSDEGTSGRIALAPDGRMLVTIGSLSQASTADPEAIGGKIVAIDLDGSPTQQPQVLASGWDDPRGITFLADGSLWVSDASDESGHNRLARVDATGLVTDVLTLPEGSRPADLEPAEGGFFVCDAATGRLDLYRAAPGAPPAYERTIVDNCTRDLTTLGGGRIAYASPEGGIRAETP